MLSLFSQTSLDRLTVELNTEQDRLRAQQESESRVRSSEEHLQSQLKLRTEQVHDLELKLKAVRQEADAQLQTTVRPRVLHTMTSLYSVDTSLESVLLQISSVEKEGRQVIDRELTSLRQQVVMTTERAHSLQVELEVTKSELKHTKVCWIHTS